MVRKTFIPYVIYVGLTLGFFFKKDTGLENFWITLTLTVLLVLFSFYFLYEEVKQVKHIGRQYFNSFYNVLDILPPIVITATVLFTTISEAMDAK